jgi:hypothetical protein
LDQPDRKKRADEAKIMIRSLFILLAICFSTSAFAQNAQPKAGNKPHVQAKPKEPSGCKLVGTVRGTRLWAGDCIGVELLRGTTETPEQGTSVIAPGEKE